MKLDQLLQLNMFLIIIVLSIGVVFLAIYTDFPPILGILSDLFFKLLELGIKPEVFELVNLLLLALFGMLVSKDLDSVLKLSFLSNQTVILLGH